MEQRFDAKALFEAIKRDDLKTFSSLLPSDKFDIKFGRFPLLSVLYLFECYKILNVYEKKLAQISKFEDAEEFYDIYLMFKQSAKKCLRFYVFNDKIIYPIEMLAVLDQRHHLNKYYKILFKNEEIVKRLAKIYKINHKVDGEISQEKLSLPKKKLNLKQKVSVIIISVVMCLVSIFSGISLGIISNRTGLGTSSSPIVIRNEKEFVTALKKGTKYYLLETDITLTDEIEANKFSGVFDGNGHTVYARGYLTEGLVDQLSGTIKNLNIVSSLHETTLTDSYSILANKVTGVVKNCTITSSIEVQAKADIDIWIAGFTAENNGTIDSCTADIDAIIANERDRNCYLSAFVGTNRGTIKNCKTMDGKFVTDTVDIAGFANENSGKVVSSENNISMTQTSEEEWHPNTSGFVNTNYGTIDSCKNYGEIYSESTLASKSDPANVFYVFAGGIACDNFGQILNSRNFANVKGISKISFVYSGGIVSMNETANGISAVVKYSKSKGEISAKSESQAVYAAGIAAYNTASVENSGFEGSVWADSTADAVASGIVAYNYASRVSDCYAQTAIVTSNITNTGSSIISGLVGINVNNVNYVYNNHYVKDSSYAYSMWFCYYDYVLELYYNFQALNDDTTRTTAYEKYDDLPSEVILDD